MKATSGVESTVRPLARPLSALIACAAVVLTSGCGHSRSSWGGDYTMRSIGHAQPVSDLAIREVTTAIPIPADGAVRIRNLAGTVTLVEGDVDSIEVVARVHARASAHANDGYVETLLEAMVWVESTDEDGRLEWTLDYPVDRHQGFHYSTDGDGYAVTARKLYGRTVEVSTSRGARPTLFADLAITCPPGVDLAVRNVMGEITAGDIDGRIELLVVAGGVSVGTVNGRLGADTHWGAIEAVAVTGEAHLDTGSGDIRVGHVDGAAHFDTGSGDITVEHLVGTAHLDTGSGDIEIRTVTARNIHADTGSGDIIVRSGTVDRMHADTGSGRIELDGVTCVRFRGHAGSGDIVLRGSLAHADWIHADTGSGAVSILGGDDDAFVVDASVGGAVHVGYENTRIDRDDGRVTHARRGEGGPTIQVDTGSGGFEISPG